MFSNFDLMTISLKGLDRGSQFEGRRRSVRLFWRAYSRGMNRKIWIRFTGRKVHLQDLNRKHAVEGARTSWTRIVSVPIGRIKGSEGRSHDFDTEFNPIRKHIMDRWVGIAAARMRGIPLPPVELIQVGEAYYVRDGHHRISVAKALGQSEIEALIVA